MEFESRENLRNNPVKGMMGYGTYNQPEGTWSDDTSLTLCLLEALNNVYCLIISGNIGLLYYKNF